jgi:hypothetical protein
MTHNKNSYLSFSGYQRLVMPQESAAIPQSKVGFCRQFTLRSATAKGANTHAAEKAALTGRQGGLLATPLPNRRRGGI